jgi:transcriptional repressor of cell division inhibition gene dicB
MTLTKQQAIEIFGSRKDLCAVLELTNARISQWPEQLDQKTSDWVIGAAIRNGKPIPDGFIPAPDPIAAT